MSKIRIQDSIIEGVKIAALRGHRDERGELNEILRYKEWFPEIDWSNSQINSNFLKKGVLKGLHYHLEQTDYWHVILGNILVGLKDLRQSSPTFGQETRLEMGGREGVDGIGLLIPNGVAHGLWTKSEVIFIYVTSKPYNDDDPDERGINWKTIDWGMRIDERSLTTSGNLIISERDMNNPLLEDIPKEDLPK